MKILVINAGSSSLKYQLIDMEQDVVLAKGNCERIGIGGRIAHKAHTGKSYEEDVNFPDHTSAFMKLIDVLTKSDAKVIDDISEISAVGHRIVQGAEKYDKSVLVTQKVLEDIEELADLAPLHNHAHAQGIRACMDVFDASVPQVVVFDTSFHQTMPKQAYMFGVPYEYYEKYHIRRYGFHGTSHRFVSARAAKIVGKDPKDLKMITCHLGNGSSITAVLGGKSVDTSMGFTPLDGFIMGTRSGGIDPSVVTYIMEKEGKSPKEMADFLNKECGYLGISGITSDHRDLIAGAKEGNKRCQLALDINRYQIKKFIGSYIAAMGGLDVLVFTGGIGENAADLREQVCSNMEFLGIKIDNDKNQIMNGKEANITAADSKVITLIVPTNEELSIARDTLEVITAAK